MLRIHFSAEDLARTRIADGPDPMWEVLLSLHLLQQPADAGVFDWWRSSVGAHVPSSAALLYELAPARGYSADFLTPPATAGATEFGTGVDAVLCTPRGRLREDIAHLAYERGSSSWTRSLAEGSAAALRRLGEALEQYHAAVLEPVWQEISRLVETERSACARTLLDHGLGRLLSTLHPLIQWDEPVLTLPYGPHDRDLYLDGRGLLVVPSFFCWRTPICLRDPTLAPVLVYPATHPQDKAIRTRPAEHLPHLTWRERQVLALMSEGSSNETITQRLGVGAKTVETYVRNIFAKLHLEPSVTHHRRVLAVLTYLRAEPHPEGMPAATPTPQPARAP